MEFAGNLHGKKRRLFVEELERRSNDNTVNIEKSEIILRAAQRMYPEDRQMRRRYTRNRLKEWEKTAAPYES